MGRQGSSQQARNNQKAVHRDAQLLDGTQRRKQNSLSLMTGCELVRLQRGGCPCDAICRFDQRLVALTERKANKIGAEVLIGGGVEW